MSFVQRLDDTFVRTELRFSVVHVEAEDRWATGSIPERQPARWNSLVEVLNRTNRPAIIYALSRRSCDELAELIDAKLGERCLSYHAGLSTAQRREREEEFLAGTCDLMVSTSAFGMGVDKADLRTVIHWQTPVSPEALYQEAGRAGRSVTGQPAEAVLLFHPRDLDDAYHTLRRQVPMPAEIRSLDLALRELADHNASEMVIATDDELVRLAGLRHEVEARVALAHLERAGLVKEVDRLSGARLLRRTGVDAELSDAERLVLNSVSEDGSPTLILVTDVADQCGLEARRVFAALRSLEARGLLAAERRISIRLLVDAEKAGAQVDAVRDVSNRLWIQLKAHHQTNGRRYLTTPGAGLGDAGLVELAIHILASFGCVELRRRESDGPIPAVRLRRTFDLMPLQSAFAVVSNLLERLGPTNVDHHLARLARALDSTEATVCDAAVLAHLCQVASAEPRSWQGDGVTQARRLLLRDVADRDEALARAAAESSGRARLQRLRLEALSRYAEIVDDDEADAHQAYLARYLTERNFLDDLTRSTADEMLTDLTARQREIALANGDVGASPVVVIAGPGTGKTRTVVQRIAYRVTAQYVLADRVLAVTFTRSATEEVRARLAQLGITGVRVRTLHSLAIRLVMAHWRRLGFKEQPNIVEDAERYSVLSALGSKSPRADARTIDLAKAKNEPLDKLGLAYDERLKKLNKLDFGDCLHHATEILRQSVGDSFRDSFDELLVDEFQDLSPAQIELVRALAGEQTNSGSHLTIVGDPRQAIFEWNGANPQSLLALDDDPRSLSLTLNENFRSCPQVLELANNVIAKVLPKLPPVVPKIDEAGDLHMTQTASDGEMFQCVVNQVAQWRKDGMADDEIAVLAYTGKVVGQLASRLKAAGIPSHAEGLSKLSTTDAFSAAQSVARELDLNDLPDDVTTVDAFDYVQSLALVDRDVSDVEHDDWARLRDFVIEVSDGAGDLASCLALVEKVDQGPNTSVGVTVTTMHKSKGLEWKAVVVADVGESSFDQKKPDPERCRLLYVAITRAKQHLLLTGVGPLTTWLN